MWKKVINFSFVGLILCGLLLGLARTVFFPKEINYYETAMQTARPCRRREATPTARFRISWRPRWGIRLPLRNGSRRGITICRPS